MKKNKGLVIKISFFVIVTIILISVIVTNNDLSDIGSVLKNANYSWLLIGLGALGAYILINAISFYILGYKKEENLGFFEFFKICSTEYFFNGITPFSTGGQPFQVYAFTQDGVKPSRATGIVLMNYVCYQLCICILCVLSFYYFDFLKQSIPNAISLVFIGLFINLLILLLFLNLGISNTFRKGLTKLIHWIVSFKCFKGKLITFEDKFISYCNDAQTTCKEVLHLKFRFFFSVIFKLLGLIVYFSMPFFILKALNISISPSQIPFICAMTTVAISMTCFIPTPGASGGIEFAFKAIFSGIVGVSAQAAVYGMLLWRFYTYYLLMLISFGIYILFTFQAKKKARKNEVLVGKRTNNEDELLLDEMIDEKKEYDE